MSERCGKVIHWERADAKKVAKASRGRRLMAYWCEPCDGWHVGTPPPELLRGEIGREDVRPTRPRR